MGCASTSLVAKTSIEEELYIVDPSKMHLSWIQKHTHWIVDHISSKGFEVYGPTGTATELKKRGIFPIDMRAEQLLSGNAADYPSFKEIEAKLKALQAAYPNLLELFSIGKSVKGRDLWVVKISHTDPVAPSVVKPEVKYISSMHGNEITGRELMMRLIEDLATGYSEDPSIKELIDSTHIYIMPSMNPDGSESKMRGNGNFVDLNRDFPDFSTSDNQNSLENRQPETQAVMKFQAGRNFSLSANFHGGAEVVNYPWDTIAEKHPLEELIVGLSLEYSELTPYIYASTEFSQGITNGYAWYEVDGGMQDWSYHWHNDLQVTIELSNQKWPQYSMIEPYYTQNRSALITYLKRVHQGAGFYFIDSKDASGSVAITDTSRQKSLGEFSFARGQFYKVLEPGHYDFFLTTKDGKQMNASVQVEVDKVTLNGNFAKLSLLNVTPERAE
mgnify:CR=1 FL=1